jgi:hypothetical protein
VNDGVCVVAECDAEATERDGIACHFHRWHRETDAAVQRAKRPARRRSKPARPLRRRHRRDEPAEGVNGYPTEALDALWARLNGGAS